jgi:hypothetical protein
MIKWTLVRTFLPVPLLLLVITTILLLFCIPIYSDELVWHSLLARFFDDGRTIINKTPQCSNEIKIQLPWILIPGRAVFSLIFYKISPPFILRATAILLSITTIYLTHRFTQISGHKTKTPKAGILTSGMFLIISAFSLGLTPAFMALARPECLFFITLTATTFVSVKFNFTATKYLGLVTFNFAGLCFLGSHPKSLFFLPVILALLKIIKVSHNSVPLKAISTSLILYTAAKSTLFYQKLYKCPLAPQLQATLAHHMIQPSKILEEPSGYFKDLSVNVLGFSRFGDAIIPPLDTVFWGWLPQHNLGQLEFLWGIFIKAGLLLAVFVIVLGILLSSYDMIKRRQPSDHILVACAAVTSEIALVAHQTIAHPYDGAFHTGMLGFIGSLFWPRIREQLGKFTEIFNGALIIFISFNFVFFISAYHPIFSYLYNYGIKGDFPTPFHSGIHLFNYQTLRNKLWHLSKQCGLDLNSAEGLLVDDISYPFAQRAKLPLHTMGINWLGADIKDQFELLKSADISSVLTGCHSLRPEIAKHSVAIDGLCCTVIK